MKTLTFVSLALLAGGCMTHSPLAAAERSAESAKPNFLIILADDMGYSDAGCYGGEIETPRLNELARNGIRFTQFYNTARCWPTRASILTGYYAQQVRRDVLPGVKSGGQGRRPDWARLLPEWLKPSGYRSYHSGKWHIDGKVLAGGFDRSYSLNDHNRFFNPQNHLWNDERLPPVDLGDDYYATTAIADYAIDMLKEHQQEHRREPFFLYLAFIAPHFPLHALQKDIDVYRERFTAGWDVIRRQRHERMKKMGLVSGTLSEPDPEIIPNWNWSPAKLREAIGRGEVPRAIPWDELDDRQKELQATKMAIHAAMIHRMDIEIGRVLDQLKTMEAFENTVIFFLSDNGASAEQIIRGDMHDKEAPLGSAKSYLCLGPGWSTAANTPFRLHKSWVHEGGISTPLIVHWPKGIAARDEVRHNPGHVIDLAPTILELAGIPWPETAGETPVPPSPGKSLAPVFKRDHTVKHDYFWWFHSGNRAVRVGDWKLVADHQKPWELYDLKADRAESNNRAKQNPAKVEELEREWERRAQEFRETALGKPAEK